MPRHLFHLAIEDQWQAAVAEGAYRLAGATAIFDSRSFERRFRDAHAVSQQVQGRHTNYETVGRFMLGLDVDTIFL